MNLLDADGNVLEAVLTGDDPSTPEFETGWYLFDRLPAGEYIVEFERPTGYRGTAFGQGDETTGSDADGVSGRTQPIVLGPDEHRRFVDAGYFETTGVGNRVWDDTNSNGVQDPDEVGIEGVRVELLDAEGTVVASTVTDSNGEYEFSDLPQGTYRVRLNPSGRPDGFVSSPVGAGSDGSIDSDAGENGLTDTFTLVAGSFNPDIDFGLHRAEIDLRLTKSLTTDFDSAGSGGAWTITVANVGPDRDPGTVTVTDRLPAGLSYVSAVPSNSDWTCQEAAKTITCATPSGMAVDETVTIIVTTNLTSPGTSGAVKNSAVVESTTAEATLTNNNGADSFEVTAKQGGRIPGVLAFTGASTHTILLLALMLLSVGGLLSIMGTSRRSLDDESTPEGSA